MTYLVKFSVILPLMVLAMPGLSFGEDAFFQSLRQPNPMVEHFKQQEREKHLEEQTEALQGIQEELQRIRRQQRNQHWHY